MQLSKDQPIYETLGSYFPPAFIAILLLAGNIPCSQPSLVTKFSSRTHEPCCGHERWLSAVGILESQIPGLHPEPQSRYLCRRRTTLLIWTNMLTLTNGIATLYHVALRMILPPGSCFWYNTKFFTKASFFPTGKQTGQMHISWYASQEKKGK